MSCFRSHVIQCHSKSFSLPVPSPLEGLNELFLSEQLKDPVRERGKNYGSHSGYVRPLVTCGFILSFLPSPLPACLGHSGDSWGVGFSEPHFRWGWEWGLQGLAGPLPLPVPLFLFVVEVVPETEFAPHQKTKQRWCQKEKKCDCHQRDPLLEAGREKSMWAMCYRASSHLVWAARRDCCAQWCDFQCPKCFSRIVPLIDSLTVLVLMCEDVSRAPAGFLEVKTNSHNLIAGRWVLMGNNALVSFLCLILPSL